MEKEQKLWTIWNRAKAGKMSLRELETIFLCVAVAITLLLVNLTISIVLGEI